MDSINLWLVMLGPLGIGAAVGELCRIKYYPILVLWLVACATSVQVLFDWLTDWSLISLVGFTSTLAVALWVGNRPKYLKVLVIVMLGLDFIFLLEGLMGDDFHQGWSDWVLVNTLLWLMAVGFRIALTNIAGLFAKHLETIRSILHKIDPPVQNIIPQVLLREIPEVTVAEGGKDFWSTVLNKINRQSWDSIALLQLLSIQLLMIIFALVLVLIGWEFVRALGRAMHIPYFGAFGIMHDMAVGKVKNEMLLPGFFALWFLGVGFSMGECFGTILRIPKWIWLAISILLCMPVLSTWQTAIHITNVYFSQDELMNTCVMVGMFFGLALGSINNKDFKKIIVIIAILGLGLIGVGGELFLVLIYWLWVPCCRRIAVYGFVNIIQGKTYEA